MLRISKHQVFAIVAGAVSLMFVASAMAEQKAPIKLAVQTTMGPSDAPVRTAIYTPADRERTKVEPVWYGGRVFYGGRGWGYRPYYSYYRAPYVRPYYYSYSYLPPPYYNYYPSPYYTYYTPPTYYSAAPSYSYYYSPGPYYYGYRTPRRVIVRGGYYW